MFQSVVLVALLPDGSAGSTPLALASLAAWLTHRHPQVSVGTHRVAPSETRLMSLVLEIHRARPDAVGFWCDGRHQGIVDAMVSSLTPVLPGSVIFALGPEVAHREGATRLLRRRTGITLAVRGEPEGPLDALSRLWQTGARLPEAPPPGVSMRVGRGVVHGEDAPALADLSLLPSPWGARETHLPDPCYLELGRGPVPWTDLPADPEQPAPYRSLPFARLEAEIQLLVGERQIPRLSLVPSPADADPFLFQQVLALLARYNQRTQVRLGLRQLPESSLTRDLRDAGVADIHVDLTLPGGKRGLGRVDLAHLRSRVGHLRDMGIVVHVGLTVGHPSQSGDALRWTIDQLVSTGVGGLTVRPLAIPPGHPLRPSVKRRGIVLCDGPPDEVLAHRRLPFEERTELVLDGEILSAFMPPWSGTLRAMGRLTRRPPSELARGLAELGAGSPVAGEVTEQLDHRHDELMNFISTVLKAEGRMDRMPVLTALARFERWLAQPERPGEIPQGVHWEEDSLGQVVPIVSPAVSSRTFSYDVVAIARGAAVEDAPVRRTHILIHRRGHGAAIARQLSEIERRALALVDGARPIAMLVEALTDEQGFEGYDIEVLADTYAQLLASGALIAAGTVAEPPEPRLRDNVLLFPGSRGGKEAPEA